VICHCWRIRFTQRPTRAARFGARFDDADSPTPLRERALPDLPCLGLPPPGLRPFTGCGFFAGASDLGSNTGFESTGISFFNKS